MDSRLESLCLDPVGCVADMKSAQTARMGLEMIVRRLITLSAFLPALPSISPHSGTVQELMDI